MFAAPSPVRIELPGGAQPVMGQRTSRWRAGRFALELPSSNYI